MREGLTSCERDAVGVDFMTVAVLVYDGFSKLYENVTEVDSVTVGELLTDFSLVNVIVAVSVSVSECDGFGVRVLETSAVLVIVMLFVCMAEFVASVVADGLTLNVADPRGRDELADGIEESLDDGDVVPL